MTHSLTHTADEKGAQGLIALLQLLLDEALMAEELGVSVVSIAWFGWVL